MRHRRAVLDDTNFKPNRLESPDGRFTAGARTFDADFDFAHAMGHGLARGVLRDLLSGKRRALARTFKTDPARGGPAEQVALHIGNGHLSVVESGQNVRDADGNVFRALGLNDL